MIWRFFILFVFMGQPVFADGVSDKIDQAIEFTQAGSNDLAKTTLQNLLKGPLSGEERATVLYNLASILARENHYIEALDQLGKITPNLLDSPLLAVSIEYMSAVCSLQAAKQKLQQHTKIPEETLIEIKNGLESAKQFLAQTVALIHKISIPDAPTHLQLTHVLEEISEQEELLSYVVIASEIGRLNKQAFIEQFLVFLYSGTGELFPLLGQPDTALYTEAYEQKTQKPLSSYFNRLFLFLQAQGSRVQTMENRYLTIQLEALKNRQEVKVGGILSKTVQLMNLLELIQAEVSQTDVSQLLDNRLEAILRMNFAPSGSPVAQFWNSQEKQDLRFLVAYLEEKRQLLVKNERPFDAALISSLLSSLKRARQDPLQEVMYQEVMYQEAMYQEAMYQEAMYDVSYWQVLSTLESKTIHELVVDLYQSRKDRLSLLFKGIIDRLKARLSVKKDKNQLAALQSLEKAQSELSPLQDVLDSYLLIDPESCLLYFFDKLQKELFTAPPVSVAGDLQELLRLLHSVLKDEKNQEANALLKQLDDAALVLSQPNSSALRAAPYEISISLSWLQEWLFQKKKTLQALVSTVDAAYDLQKKMIYFINMASRSRVAELFPTSQLFMKLQSDSVERMQDILSNCHLKDQARGRKVKEMLLESKELLAAAPQSFEEIIISMYKAQDLLEKISKLLHEEAPKPEPEKTEEESKEEQKEEQMSGASIQLQKRTLHLSPETSIRLLQEMEREDRSLEVPVKKEGTAVRPW